jgi:hypothetical protein
MTTCLDVFEGRAAKLEVGVDVGLTKAKRDIAFGVWVLDREWLTRILEHIAEAQTDMKQKKVTPRQVAVRCDEEGLGERFFRLDSVVAQWINETDPTTSLDFLI